MPNNLKNASEIFEIERIRKSYSDNNKHPSRSLVFKISKISKGGKKTKDIINKFSTKNCKFRSKIREDASKNLQLSEPNPQKENINTDNQASEMTKKPKIMSSPPHIQQPNLTMKDAGNKIVELRRTSRRITMRVQNDFFSDPREYKRKKKSSKIQKRTISSLQAKKNHGRRGRPRKVQETKLILPEKNELSKANGSTKTSGNSTPWTLLANEMKSSYLYSSRPKIKSQEQNYTSMKNEAISSSLSHKNENADLRKTPLKSILRKDQNYFQKPSSTKPTVIYFNTAKNNAKLIVSGIVPQKPPYHVIQNCFSDFQTTVNNSHQEKWIMSYLRQKYRMISEPVLAYFYDVGLGNLQRTEIMLREFLSTEIKALHSQDIPSVVLFDSKKALSESSGETNEDEYPVLNTGELSLSCVHYAVLKTTVDDVDTLYRQVIADSIRLLYDEESVLGY